MQTIQEQRINCIMLVPTMIYALLDHPRFSEFDLSSLETVFYGASAIAPARLKEAIERIGPVFFQFYGQAEAPMSICLLRKAEHDVNDMNRLASCGRPVPWVNVALLGANNQPVARVFLFPTWVCCWRTTCLFPSWFAFGFAWARTCYSARWAMASTRRLPPTYKTLLIRRTQGYAKRIAHKGIWVDRADLTGAGKTRLGRCAH
jgi:acyl-CoA synthetase (AMP-forming)/AMP-acid ligase II